MRPVCAFGAAGAGAGVGADADVDVDVGNSDNDGENDGARSSGVAPQKARPPLVAIHYVDHHGPRVYRC